MPAFYKEWFYKTRLAVMAKIITKPQPKPLLLLGADSSKQLCRTISQCGAKNILVVTDRPLVELGLLESTLNALSEHGVNAQVYDGVLPDPTRKVVDEGIAVLHGNQCDSVLAFGGGSSIDAAKVIALAGANQCSAQACEGVGKCKLPALPFYAIPTTAGTGSEATFIAVISDDETHQKGAVIDPSIIPRAAALDPALMLELPRAITAATGMDALTHAIESYIGVWETGETNYYGLAASRLVFDNLARACSDGADIHAREAMALASFYGGMAITNALVGYVHAISHNLGAFYSIPHGLGNAMVLPHVLEKLKAVSAKKLSEIALNANLGDNSEGEDALAQKVIDKVWALNEQIGIPKTTDAIRPEDIDALVDAALAEGSAYPTPRFFDRHECREILESLSVPG